MTNEQIAIRTNADLALITKARERLAVFISWAHFEEGKPLRLRDWNTFDNLAQEGHAFDATPAELADSIEWLLETLDELRAKETRA